MGDLESSTSDDEFYDASDLELHKPQNHVNPSSTTRECYSSGSEEDTDIDNSSVEESYGESDHEMVPLDPHIDQPDVQHPAPPAPLVEPPAKRKSVGIVGRLRRRRSIDYNESDEEDEEDI